MDGQIPMKRVIPIAATSLLLSLASAAPAVAANGTGPHHGSEIVQGAAYEGQTGASIFAENGQIHYIVTRDNQCWYPQSWLDDALVQGTSSPYYTYVSAVAFDPEAFSPDVPEVGGASCIQHVYHGFDSCTDENRIGVLSIDALWDARRGTIGSFGDIGLHEYSDRYCVEIVDVDRWRQIIRASDYLPRPVRATYPQFRTLVGLENRVWYDVAPGNDRYVDGFHVSLPTPGTTYEIDVSIWLQEVAIDIDGDGHWDHTATCSTGDASSLTDCGGTADHPLLTFEYDERAYHRFVIESRWAGRAIDEDGLVHVLDPNFLAVQYTFDWETVEVRSSLDG